MKRRYNYRLWRVHFCYEHKGRLFTKERVKEAATEAEAVKMVRNEFRFTKIKVLKTETKG